ncbi:C2H2-type zinc finger protein [Aspergillus lucknowensis]|uniref:C2H2-type domain-containing protein n=1 Tax=Aspergillus lucknowensis TaxID=176173 RepID=A0ABR4LVQ2_9EURO
MVSQSTMTLPIACPPMEPSSSSFSSYSSYSSNSSYSTVSDESSLSVMDMYHLMHGNGNGTVASPASVNDVPLYREAFEPSSLDSAYYDFNPTFISTPAWSPTSMPPLDQSMFPPLDGLSQEQPKPAKPYGCEDCGKSFTRPADLKRHQSTVHYPVFQNCPVADCSRKDNNGFPRRDHLVEHLRSYHHMDVPKRRAAKRLRVA